MYFITIALLLFLFPIVSVAIEAAMAGGADIWWLVGKWFVFWGSGVRLFLAGLMQTFRPEFTSKSIFNIDAPAAQAIVREVGFGNLSMGALALATLTEPRWIVPAAVVSGLYYGLAGLGHLFRQGNLKERVALWTDFWMFVILAIFIVHQLA